MWDHGERRPGKGSECRMRVGEEERKWKGEPGEEGAGVQEELS